MTISAERVIIICAHQRNAVDAQAKIKNNLKKVLTRWQKCGIIDQVGIRNEQPPPNGLIAQVVRAHA